jgi:hypothetical protein
LRLIWRLILISFCSVMICVLIGGIALGFGIAGKFFIEYSGSLFTGHIGFGLAPQTIGMIDFFVFVVPSGTLVSWAIYRAVLSWKIRKKPTKL